MGERVKSLIDEVENDMKRKVILAGACRTPIGIMGGALSCRMGKTE